MSRPKRLQTSADIAAEIRRLEEERQRAIVAEDQRRGALLREYLGGPQGRAIRSALAAAVAPRDAYLFDFEGDAGAQESAALRDAAAFADGGPRRQAAQPAVTGGNATRRDLNGISSAPLPA